MAQLRFKVGDRNVAFCNRAGWTRRGTIIEASDDIKDGRAGYSIELGESMEGDTIYWGYESQFSR